MQQIQRIGGQSDHPDDRRVPAHRVEANRHEHGGDEGEQHNRIDYERGAALAIAELRQYPAGKNRQSDKPRRRCPITQANPQHPPSREMASEHKQQEMPDMLVELQVDTRCHYGKPYCPAGSADATDHHHNPRHRPGTPRP